MIETANRCTADKYMSVDYRLTYIVRVPCLTSYGKLYSSRLQHPPHLRRLPKAWFETAEFRVSVVALGPTVCYGKPLRRFRHIFSAFACSTTVILELIFVFVVLRLRFVYKVSCVSHERLFIFCFGPEQTPLHLLMPYSRRDPSSGLDRAGRLLQNHEVSKYQLSLESFPPKK